MFAPRGGSVLINLNTNKFVVWGLRNTGYNTFRHIQEAWYRALKFKFPDREVLWIDDRTPDLDKIDFSNSLFLSVNVADLRLLPKRKDCFYVIHNTDESTKELFGDISQYGYMNYGMHVSTNNPGNDIEVGYEMYLSLQEHEKYTCVTLRWGTDLFPNEIEKNKALIFNPESKEINFVGTVYENVHGPFRRACLENGINFNTYGGYTGQAPLSIEENIWMVRASHFAPAIGDKYHAQVGYIPCRVYKNISYGRMPIINNKYAQEAFKGRLIHNDDTYKLFYDAKEQLPKIDISVLHDLMDEVAVNHTYVSKLDGILKAVRITQEARG